MLYLQGLSLDPNFTIVPYTFLTTHPTQFCSVRGSGMRFMNNEKLFGICWRRKKNHLLHSAVDYLLS